MRIFILALCVYSAAAAAAQTAPVAIAPHGQAGNPGHGASGGAITRKPVTRKPALGACNSQNCYAGSEGLAASPSEVEPHPIPIASPDFKVHDIPTVWPKLKVIPVEPGPVPTM